MAPPVATGIDDGRRHQVLHAVAAVASDGRAADDRRGAVLRQQADGVVFQPGLGDDGRAFACDAQAHTAVLQVKAFKAPGAAGQTQGRTAFA